MLVASFTDAWIETLGNVSTVKSAYVASFTDAWIETDAEAKSILVTMSHLLQMRGLKHRDAAVFKLHQDVASFTDAWIETGTLALIIPRNLVASFTDAWIETAQRYILPAL